ncbi:hypothetical protein ZIOFF_001825 [Zingiber officinale]|uniref:Uncharacterized protein n=1 Tax=Zingiber officinale TaxID=94328 RepID=A0A8J5HVE1_ZINOF|nr:hypothetical protein ZIOFF_001825 [Zingiber officinale]
MFFDAQNVLLEFVRVVKAREQAPQGGSLEAVPSTVGSSRRSEFSTICFSFAFVSMEFLKIRSFRGIGIVKAVEDEYDDDFVTNEVKRRLKELRKNNFMVLIPEEGYPEEEEGGGSSSSGWRESEEGGDAPWCTFNAIYAKYRERMTFFDKLMVKSLKEVAYGTHNIIGSLGASKHSQSSLSKKLYMNLLNLPIKAQNGHCDGNEILRSQQEDSPCENLEAAYVSQVCLSWEILHNHFHIEGKSLEEKKSLLAKCAATTLSSKLIGGEKEFFANMVVEAILAIGNDDRLNLIGIKKIGSTSTVAATEAAADEEEGEQIVLFATVGE